MFRGPHMARVALIALACAGAAWGALLAGATAAWATTQVVAMPFGDPGWTPLIGDWDGSGDAQIGAYAPSTATFYLGDNNGTAARVPAPGSKRHPRVRTKVVIKWTWDGGRTGLRRFSVHGLPRGGKVTVTCSGPGCRRRPRNAVAKGLARMIHGLEQTVYRAGDRLRVTISAPGRVSERAEVRIRNGRKPLVRAL